MKWLRRYLDERSPRVESALPGAWRFGSPRPGLQSGARGDRNTLRARPIGFR
jgi:hypothetical protein